MVIYNNSLVIVFNSVITPKAAAGHDYLLTIADHDLTMISTPSILYARVGVVLYTYLI